MQNLFIFHNLHRKISWFRISVFHFFDEIYELDTPDQQGLWKNRKYKLRGLVGIFYLVVKKTCSVHTFTKLFNENILLDSLAQQSLLKNHKSEQPFQEGC